MFTPEQLQEMSAGGDKLAMQRKIEEEAARLARMRKMADAIINLLMEMAEEAANAGRYECRMQVPLSLRGHVVLPGTVDMVVAMLRDQRFYVELDERFCNEVKILLRW